MRHAFLFILIALGATFIGIGSAAVILNNTLLFNTIKLGQWEIRPKAGERDADPYTKAFLSREGSTWMGLSEGLYFIARHDEEGNNLASQCTYLISGKIPRGRLWSLAVHSANSESSLSPTYITSTDTIWLENEVLEINLSKNPQFENWLPVQIDGTFYLSLRIYDTPLTSGALDAAVKTPKITKKDCS